MDLSDGIAKVVSRDFHCMHETRLNFFRRVVIETVIHTQFHSPFLPLAAS